MGSGGDPSLARQSQVVSAPRRIIADDNESDGTLFRNNYLCRLPVPFGGEEGKRRRIFFLGVVPTPNVHGD